MFARLSLIAVLLVSTTALASAKCLTDQPLDAQAKSFDYDEARSLAMQAWQKRVASTVGKGEKFEPAQAEKWVENVRKQEVDGKTLYIFNVSGIPCF